MALTKPTQITVPFASSGLKNTIPETATGSNRASMQEGFPAITMQDVDQGGMAPYGQDMNGIIYDVTKAIQYQQAGGFFPYDATFAAAIDGYPIGAIVTSADGTQLFQNTLDGNQSDPENGGANWSNIMTSASLAGKQDKLNQTQMDAVNSGITSAKVAIYDSYASTKQNTLTFDNTPINGSSNPVTSDGIYAALGTKQDIITVDATPQSGSTNPVQSGGVYDALSEKVDVDDADDAEVTATGSTESRTLADRFADVINVKDYGAVGDGVTDDTVAIQSMISSEGYARFPKGDFLCSTTTLDAPLYFDVDGALTVASGNTITITGDIESPNQFIFRGNGNYALDNDSDSGDDSRHVHASWFGAVVDELVDQAPRIQKAFDAFGNLREGVVNFDVGIYRIASPMTVNRGIWIRGQGTRRTVFSQFNGDADNPEIGDGFTVFTSAGDAVRFSGIQFENWNQGGKIRNSPYIDIQHNQCEIYDVSVGRSNSSIVVSGSSCRIENILVVFSDTAPSPSSSSSVIDVTNNNHIIRDIYSPTSSTIAPNCIVSISASSGALIDSVRSVTPCPCVLVGNGVSKAVIQNIAYINGLTTVGLPIADSCVKVLTTGSGGIDGLSITGIHASNRLTNGIVISHGSSATAQDIYIDDVDIEASSKGIVIEKTGTGALRDIVIGSGVNVAECSTPYDISGATNLRINATALPNANACKTYGTTIADDSVYVVDTYALVYTGILIVSVATNNYFFGIMRCAGSPNSITIQKSNNLETVNSVLTGTTGNDGKFTLGFQSGKLYLENRLGSSQRVSVSILTGDM